MTEYRNLGYKKVFVSLDGSDEQARVLDRAIQMAQDNEAELYIGHVIDSTVLETAGTYPTELVPTLESAFRDEIAEQVDRAKHTPEIGKVEVVVETGRIRETLKDVMLDRIEPDIVICGARGLSSIKYALLGSISTFLIRTAKCDVLVVK